MAEKQEFLEQLVGEEIKDTAYMGIHSLALNFPCHEL